MRAPSNFSKVNQSDPAHDPFKSSRYFFFPDRPCDFLKRFLLLVCLTMSVSVVVYSTFYARPSGIRLSISRPDSVQKFDSDPTNISHILFGISGSSATWQSRINYTNLWWEPNKTRGFLWLDEELQENRKIGSEEVVNTMPYRVSDSGWTRFRYSSSRSAVRVARVIWDNFKLKLPNVRWFVMGDDDTVFFTRNVVSVLTKYDHNQMWYIGSNSESVEQNVMHAYDMAYGGGGFAVSYPLAEKLVSVLDGCLERYYYFYGSDQRIWACMNEIGVSLTPEHGFHQMDVREDPYGLLAAHPITPLVSLHHIDSLNPLFPDRSRLASLESLFHAYRVDPNRIMQQSFCYDKKRKWSISISWGYTVQIYPFLLSANDLAKPLQTFKTWRSWKDGPFMFNTRPVSQDPCEHPIVYFLDQAENVGRTGTFTSYNRSVPKFGKACEKADYVKALATGRISVSSLRMDPEYWDKAPKRQCCEIKDRGSRRGSSTMRLRVRKCRTREIMAV